MMNLLLLLQQIEIGPVVTPGRYQAGFVEVPVGVSLGASGSNRERDEKPLMRSSGVEL
jgi:hypothetical protein